jgi:transcriptional regulator with XRE-family HTH domain
MDIHERFLAIFGAELRALRVNAGLSIHQLANRLGCPVPMLEAIEGGHQMPSAPLVRGCEQVFRNPGTLARIAAHFPDLSLPASYRPYHNVELQALVVRVCEHSLIPGILQTTEYARLVLSTKAGATPQDIENRVRARIARQVLTSQGTKVRALVDEAALRRPIGGPDVMYDQLAKLDGLFDRPQVTIQLVPYDAGGHTGLNGSFTLADLPDGSTIAYVDDATDGRTTEDRGTLAMLGATFDTLSRVALDREASRAAIKSLARDLWTQTVRLRAQPGASPRTAATTARTA